MQKLIGMDALGLCCKRRNQTFYAPGKPHGILPAGKTLEVFGGPYSAILEITVMDDLPHMPT